jgi:hypothetical protein
MEGDGETVFRRACKFGFEGIVAARWRAERPAKKKPAVPATTSRIDVVDQREQVTARAKRDQPLTPERGEEIANTMAGAGCTARLPSADVGVPPRFPAKMTPQARLKISTILSKGD